jgi:hypothetical protein
LRAVTLDLIGLPPKPEDVDAFLADTAPDAYERAVERLMASPHYGERMALPWLDAARFADSNGFQQDGDTFPWVWRDWVVRALNADMPFDRFSIEQLAGDLLPNPDHGPTHRDRFQPQPSAQRRRRRDSGRAAVQQSFRSRGYDRDDVGWA